jgi:arginyl-tRNA synthetase
MHVSFDIAAHLEATLKAAASRGGLEDAATFVPEVRPADPRHGDFQANGVLGYAKARKLNPRPVAEQLVAALPEETKQQCDVAIAGPGFINFTLKPAYLHAWLAQHDSTAHLQAGAAASAAYAGQTWVIDYSAPNTAKQMHVGHLRSAVIGEAIARLLAFSNARVIRDNHIGDWGTQFGKLIWAYKKADRAALEAALAREPLEEFERLYKVGNASAESDPDILKHAQNELVKLQNGDAENLAIWKKINDVSLAAFQQIYDLLGIRFDVTLGESFYNDKVAQIYRELADCGLAVESQGALVVFHPEHPRFKEQPFIIRKSDGAANYASTDLATILYRAEHFRAHGIIYVVDSRQRDHFDQLFLTAGEWFKRTQRKLPVVHHVDFGTVLGDNGKPLKTRSGDNIKLRDLLAEAEERAFVLVTEKAPELPEAERRDIANAVGIGAVRYADLAQNRASDYVFNWDKILSFEGNTAPYLLYAVARIHSIFRKAGLDPNDGPAIAGATPPATDAEIALARRLTGFAAALQLTTAQLRPHFLCMYLYELAGQFSTFYTADKVIVDDPAIRARRLQLCARTLLILETGLHLLGLRTLQRM